QLAVQSVSGYHTEYMQQHHTDTAPQQETRFIIQGGHPLNGDITVSGMKNAVTPILAATVLVNGICELTNVPRLSDVERMVDIFRSLGASVEWTGANALRVDTRHADITALDAKSVK